MQGRDHGGEARLEAAIMFHVGDDEGLDDGHVIGDDMNFKNIFMR